MSKISYILFIYLPFESTHTYVLLMLIKLQNYLQLKIFAQKSISEGIIGGK
jgi:hypothetical protein